MVVEHAPLGRGTQDARARASSPRARGRPCVPGRRRPRSRSAPGRARAPPRRRARRGRRAAGRRPRRAGRSIDHQRLVADLDLAPLARARGAKRRLELLGRGRTPLDAKAAIGAQDPECRRARLRPVDEEVGERLRVHLGRGLRRAELEQLAPEVVDAGPGRGGHGEDSDDPLVLARRAPAPPGADRPC